MFLQGKVLNKLYIKKNSKVFWNILLLNTSVAW